MESLDKKYEEIKVPFWSENPNILLSPDSIFQLFPTETMDFNARLNAISRAVILLTLASFLYTKQIRILFVGGLTIATIYFMYYYKDLERKRLEQFENPALEVISKNKLDSMLFDTPSSMNPLSNVLVSDIDSNPQKRPAPPTFGENTRENILNSAKQMVIEQNSGQPDIADKLFRDLGDELTFEQSMRQFHSMPSTTIPEDQAAFAEFCYGDMISCKEGNKFACARNLDRYTN
jgi:hypothetical protein